MNRKEHLLTILIEECAELQKEVCKVKRFGYDIDGRVKMQHEFNDIIALIAMLHDEGVTIYEQKHLIHAKIEKVNQFLLKSKECGTLTE